MIVIRDAADSVDLRLDCADAQSDLELQYPHISEFFFFARRVIYLCRPPHSGMGDILIYFCLSAHPSVTKECPLSIS